MQRYFLIGYMGSGKTTMGRIMAKNLGFEFVDLDVFIESRYRLTIQQIFQKYGEDEFRRIEKECLHEVAGFENTVISTGGGAPCFFDNMEFMKHNGCTIYIEMDARQLTDRLLTTQTATRPLIAGKSPDELFAFISMNLDKRQPYYSQAEIAVSGDDVYLENWFRNFKGNE